MIDIAVEVAFALPERQVLIALVVPEGSTVAQAIEKSGIKQRFEDVDFSQCKVGIWSRVVPESQTLREGDRVELYRPLLIDPKEVRRARAGKS